MPEPLTRNESRRASTLRRRFHFAEPDAPPARRPVPSRAPLVSPIGYVAQSDGATFADLVELVKFGQENNVPAETPVYADVRPESGTANVTNGRALRFSVDPRPEGPTPADLLNASWNPPADPADEPRDLAPEQVVPAPVVPGAIKVNIDPAGGVKVDDDALARGLADRAARLRAQEARRQGPTRWR